MFLAMAIVATVSGGLRIWPRTVDDAFITYRYARNLVRGLGPNFNAGERVEGYSSPSWMILMASTIATGLDPVPASKALGLAASVSLLGLLYAGLKRTGVVGWGAGLASLLLATSAVFLIWSTAGMETNAYALLLFAGLVLLARGVATTRGLLGASLLLVAAALTRPEGLAFWGLGLLFVLLAPGVDARTGVAAPRLRNAVLYGLPGLLLLVHLGFRLAYYRALLPNTYYVKTGGGVGMWKQGLEGLFLFVRDPAHLVWLAAAVAGGAAGVLAWGWSRPVALMSGAALLHLLYVVSVGDDGLRIHRFYVAILPPLAFLVGLLFGRSPARPGGTRWLRALGVLAIALAVPMSARSMRAEILAGLTDGAVEYQEGNERLGRLLRDTRRADTLVAVGAAGAIPYYSGLPTLDMYGLNDRHIARQPFPDSGGARLMKWDNGYVLSRRPDVIVINRGYFRAGAPFAERVRRNPALLAAGPMDRDLFRHVAKDGSYAFRSLRFPDGAEFFVFERGSEIEPDALRER